MYTRTDLVVENSDDSLVQGAVGDGMYGQGVMSQAALDPVNGHPLIEDSPDEDHKYRLTDEAAIRQAKYEREHSRASTPLSWLDHSEDVPASPGYDAGRYKLDRFGVRT